MVVLHYHQPFVGQAVPSPLVPALAAHHDVAHQLLLVHGRGPRACRFHQVRQASPRSRPCAAAQGRAAALPRRAAAAAPAFERSDVTAYTDAVLTWWRTNAGAIAHWALAARIVFAISPNSASCERVFSLLNLMYGDQQISTLADSIRAGLMLRYNGRKVG